MLSLRALRSQTTAVPSSFFHAPTTALARKLLGCVVVHGPTAGMIVETEAYVHANDLGEPDLASHSARGNTPRTRVIFGPPGRAYVYFIYGMHECLNIVAEPDGKAGCVLIRALQPLSGIPLMQRRRQWFGRLEDLANGPGKLTQALAITRTLYGARLDRGALTIRAWRSAPSFTIAVTSRIGIRQCSDWPLRFVWADHPCISHPAHFHRDPSARRIQSPDTMLLAPSAAPAKM